MEWAWYLTGGLGLAAALLLLARALFADRSKGRLRCPKCWYDMSGTAGLTCPECGNNARHARRLTKTKRRWGRAGLAAALIVTSAAIASFPQLRGEGWVRVAPTTLLILGVPLCEDPDDVRIKAVSERLFEKRWRGTRLSAGTSWQHRLLARCCASVLSRPGPDPLDPTVLGWLDAMDADAAPAVDLVIDELIALEQSSNYEGRWTCRSILSSCAPTGASRAVPVIIGLLEEDSTDSGYVTLLGLYGPYAAEAIPLLRELVRAPTPASRWDDTRAAAAQALGRIGPLAQPALDDILSLLGQVNDAPDKGLCIEALGSIDPLHPEVAGLLLECLFEPEAIARTAAAQSIATEPALIAQATDRAAAEYASSDPARQMASLRALLSLAPAGAQASRGIATTAAQSNDPVLRVYSSGILKALDSKE